MKDRTGIESLMRALESDADIQKKAVLLQLYVAAFGGIPEEYKERVVNGLYKGIHEGERE
jgi:hypothetical protein